MTKNEEEQLVLISRKLGLFGTPGERALFDDGASRMEQAVLACAREHGLTEPQEIAAHLELSLDSVLFFLDRLTRGEHSLRTGRHQVPWVFAATDASGAFLSNRKTKVLLFDTRRRLDGITSSGSTNS